MLPAEPTAVWVYLMHPLLLRLAKDGLRCCVPHYCCISLVELQTVTMAVCVGVPCSTKDALAADEICYLAV